MVEAGLQPAAIEGGSGLSQWQRISNIFSSPSKTFLDIRRGNRSWWLPLILSIVASYLFFAVVAQKIGLEQSVENQIRFSPKTEERMSQLTAEQRATNISIGVAITKATFIAYPAVIIAFTALLSLGLLGTINLVFGGKASYGGIFAVWFYAWLPQLIKSILGIIVIFAGTAPESFNLKNFAPTNIGAFLDPVETNKALYALASALDVVTIWSLILLAGGTAIVAGVKRSSGYLAVFGWWAIFVLFRVGIAAIAG
jgi:hypothetical protein